MLIRKLIVTTLLLCFNFANAQELPVQSKHGMVASQETLASHIGADILKQGGNAIDAAVAVGYALAVTLPVAGNLGGGGFMLIHLAHENKNIALNYREIAPQAAHRDMFLDEKGQVDRKKIESHALSSGVPGTVMGLNAALEKYGTMSLKQVIQPAIDLANKGFPVYPELAKLLVYFKKKLNKNPDTQKIFYHADGSALATGETLKQQDLAHSLKIIRDQGTAAFYHGSLALKIANSMQHNHGILSKKDFAQYHIEWQEPVSTTFHGYRVISMPPPSSGGTTLITLLNAAESLPLKDWGMNSSKTIHYLSEVMNMAYVDRSYYLGDPNFIDVPVARLTSKKHGQQLAKKVLPNRHLNPDEIGDKNKLRIEGKHTTHYSVIDAQGNAVSNTYTLNSAFGNGIVAHGTGILMNDEMDDFSAKPGIPNQFGVISGHANKIEAGKRPLSSMTPTIVFSKDNKQVIATGSPGGSRIITTVFQTLLNILVFDMDIRQAANAPRFHSQWYPDYIRLEAGFERKIIRELQKLLHQTQIMQEMGSVQTVMKQDHIFYGASDRRRGGAAVGA